MGDFRGSKDGGRSDKKKKKTIGKKKKNSFSKSDFRAKSANLK